MDRVDWFFKQVVTEAEMDGAFDDVENALFNVALDWGMFGILDTAASPMVVTEFSGTPNLTVDITAGQAYDQAGQRVRIPSSQNLDVSVDSSSVTTAVAGGGNEKIVSVFAKFNRALSDPRTDGNSNTVFFERDESFVFIVRQGAEGAPPATPPALEADAVLLAEIRRSFGQTQIFNTDITPPGGSYTGIANRRQDGFSFTTGTLSLRQNTIPDAIENVLQQLNDHVNDATAAHTASAIDVAIASVWADATGIAGINLDSALEEFVTDLAATGAGADGAGRVGAETVAGSPTSLATTTIGGQLAELLTAVNARTEAGVNESITGAWDFQDTITTSPAAITDPAWVDDRDNSAGFILQAEWRFQNTNAQRIRIYTSIGLLGDFLVTKNFRYNGTSNNFDPDVGAGTQWALRVGDSGILLRHYSGAGTKDIIAATPDAEKSLLGSINSSAMFGDATGVDDVFADDTTGGVTEMDDLSSAFVSARDHAENASDDFGGGSHFGKQFSVNPSTFGGQVDHLLVNASSPILDVQTPNGMQYFSEATAAGDCDFVSTVNVS